MHKSYRETYLKFLFVYFSLLVGYYIILEIKAYLLPEITIHGPHRSLLQINNCTPRSVEQFPNDFLTQKQKKEGGIIFHIAVSIYLFISLAIICDEYFVSSLERMCEVLHIKHDVAGATFMAAGSSAPELCTSVIGVFITANDVGISTIVGSAVFNVLCIVAICGIFVGSAIYLTWWPLFRDSVVYCISIVTLIFVLYDGSIKWYEAFIMIIIYVFYIILLYNNEKVHSFILKRLPISKVSNDEEANPLILQKTPNSLDLMDSTDEELTMETGDVDSARSVVKLDSDMTNIDGESPSIFVIPDSFLKRLYWVAMLPVTILCFLTIPDCRKPGCWRNLFFLTFTISVIWISVITYLLVWMICLTGDTAGIPDTVMGLTILAAGTSIPDALAGYLVAKEGYGDMALSNSLGSNVFDILICLGLPWMIRTSFISPGSVIPVSSSGMLYTVITLLSALVIMVALIMISKWRINRLLGFIFLILYILIITFSCLYELGVFGGFILPPCPRSRL